MTIGYFPTQYLFPFIKPSFVLCKTTKKDLYKLQTDNHACIFFLTTVLELNYNKVSKVSVRDVKDDTLETGKYNPVSLGTLYMYYTPLNRKPTVLPRFICKFQTQL